MKIMQLDRRQEYKKNKPQEFLILGVFKIHKLMSYIRQFNNSKCIFIGFKHRCGFIFRARYYYAKAIIYRSL